MRATPVNASGAASVGVRVSGELPGIARFLDALTAAAQTGGFEVAEPPWQGLRAYPNHREPGFRVYLTIQFLPEQDTVRAGRRTAAKQSAAPLPQPRRH